MPIKANVRLTREKRDFVPCACKQALGLEESVRVEPCMVEKENFGKALALAYVVCEFMKYSTLA